MKSLFRHIVFCISGLTTLLLFLAVSPSVAQNSGLSLKLTIEMAKKQGIPEQTLNSLLQRAHGKNVPDEEVAGMLQPAVEMASQKLPYNLVIQKSLEGMTKDVQPAIIIKIEKELQSNVLNTAQMTDEWLKEPSIQSMLSRSGESQNSESYRDQVLTTIARVSSQGVPRKELGQLLSGMAQNNVAASMIAGQVPAAIEILPDLPTTKNHPAISRALILQAIKSHLTSDQIQQLPVAMATAEQMGQVSAEALANSLSRQMNKGKNAMTILQELFEGNFKSGAPNGIPPGLNNPHSRNPHGNNGHGMNHPGNSGNGNG